jgi:hypothetical protein
MDITTLAHKNLDILHGYIDIEHADLTLKRYLFLNFQPLSEDEKIIGFYLNQSLDHDLIIITDLQIVICDLDRLISIKYDDIESVHTEPSKNSNTIFVRQKDGSSDSILVSGIKGDKFLDIYGFSRFLKKILVNLNLNNAVSLTV